MRHLLSIVSVLLPCCLSAQEVAVADSVGVNIARPMADVEVTAGKPQFGVVDYDGILRLLPEWQQAQDQIAELRAKYEAEAQRAEGEFQRKFAEFLDGQKDFPENIMQKRQKELQTLLEESVAFRQSAQELLHQAESDLTDNARRRLNLALQTVAAKEELLFIFSSSQGQILPYVDESRVLDCDDLVLQLLKLSAQ